jgi:hypothetical protein
LAIRILPNSWFGFFGTTADDGERSATGSTDHDERLAEFDGLSALGEDLLDHA